MSAPGVGRVPQKQAKVDEEEGVLKDFHLAAHFTLDCVFNSWLRKCKLIALRTLSEIIFRFHLEGVGQV